MRRQGQSTAPDPAVTTMDMPDDDDPMQYARIYKPVAAVGAGPLPVIVYYHGGGWVIAGVNTYDATPRAVLWSQKLRDRAAARRVDQIAGEKEMKLYVLAAATLIATPGFAQVMIPVEYVKTAGASDLYERQSSQIVLQSTTDPRVRQFTQMMIMHHTKSTAEGSAPALRQAAAGIVPVVKAHIAMLRRM